jgi:cytochrome b subunit of formate dehydrogenase
MTPPQQNCSTPATRPALRGITLGAVRRDWAEHHHARWVEAFDARAAEDASVTGARPAGH